MKKFLSVVLCAMLLLSVSAVAETVDTYTSASTTKSVVVGDELAALRDTLSSSCSDLATLAETQAEGYVAPTGKVNAQIVSVNPDGSVGLSTVSEWKYVKSEDGADQVIVELTYGQNALNLSEENARGSLIVVLNGATYILHLDVVESDEQVYTEEGYATGEFNSHYSGSANALSSYTVTSNVLSIEKSYAIIW